MWTKFSFSSSVSFLGQKMGRKKKEKREGKKGKKEVENRWDSTLTARFVTSIIQIVKLAVYEIMDRMTLCQYVKWNNIRPNSFSFLYLIFVSVQYNLYYTLSQS